MILIKSWVRAHTRRLKTGGVVQVRQYSNSRTKNLKPHEYKKVINSPEFKAWFKGSKVVDAEGNPLIVFHGTTHEFHTFSKKNANYENDFGAGFYFSNTHEDVQSNYAGEGPDLTQRIELLADQLMNSDEYETHEAARRAAKKMLAGGRKKTMKVFLNLQNPVVIGSPNSTWFEMNYDEETGEESGSLVDFIEALRDAASYYDEVKIDEAIADIIDHDTEMTAGELVDILNKSEGLMYATDYDNDSGLVAHEIIRRAFELMGFDGIIDQSVNDKFGSKRRVGRSMAGMHEGTVHYIAFKPEQIKSIDNRGTFNPHDGNIYKSEGAMKTQHVRGIDGKIIKLCTPESQEDYDHLVAIGADTQPTFADKRGKGKGGIAKALIGFLALFKSHVKGSTAVMKTGKLRTQPDYDNKVQKKFEEVAIKPLADPNKEDRFSHNTVEVSAKECNSLGHIKEIWEKQPVHWTTMKIRVDNGVVFNVEKLKKYFHVAMIYPNGKWKLFKENSKGTWDLESQSHSWFAKSHVSGYQRRTPSGGISSVKDYDNTRRQREPDNVLDKLKAALRPFTESKSGHSFAMGQGYVNYWMGKLVESLVQNKHGWDVVDVMNAKMILSPDHANDTFKATVRVKKDQTGKVSNASFAMTFNKETKKWHSALVDGGVV